jgi:hypothetical protein
MKKFILFIVVGCAIVVFLMVLPNLKTVDMKPTMSKSFCWNYYLCLKDETEGHLKSFDLKQLSGDLVKEIIAAAPGYGHGPETKYLVKNKNINLSSKQSEIIIVTTNLFALNGGDFVFKGPYMHIAGYSDGRVMSITEEEYQKINRSEFIELKDIKFVEPTAGTK